MINQLAKQFIKTNDTNPLVLKIADFTQISGGFFVGSSVLAATTTTPNDSLIMPANHYKIIKALKRIGEYSKYYTNDSSPKTVLIEDVSQCSRIRSTPNIASLVPGTTYTVKKDYIIHNNTTYNVGATFVAVNTLYIGAGVCVSGLDNALFFNSTTKTKFYLFNRTQTEEECIVLYTTVFDYLPITQDSDSFSCNIAVTTNTALTFDWDDGSVPEVFNLTTTASTVAHTYSTRLGLTKNIKVTGIYANIKSLNFAVTTSAATIYLGKITNLIETRSSGSLVAYTGTVVNHTGIIAISSNGNDCSTHVIDATGNSALVTCYLPKRNMNILKGVTSKIPVVLTSYNQQFTFNPGVVGNITASSVLKNGWTAAQIDAFLIAFATTAATVTSKTIDLQGNNEGRTTSSDAAVATLISKGWTVKTSNGWIFKGDSITLGSAATVHDNSWTAMLCANKGKTELNFGTGSQCLCRVNGYQFDIESEFPYYSGNKLFISYGINDIFANYTTDEVSTNLTFCLNYIINVKKWPTNQIIIGGISYNTSKLSQTPAYNIVIQNIANTFGVQFLDFWTYMLNNGGATLLYTDGVHPNDAGHAAMATYAISQIQ